MRDEAVHFEDPRRWGRRGISVGGLLLATVVAVVTAPVWGPLAWLVDWATGRSLGRAAAFVVWYLLHSVWGVAAALGLWVARAVGRPGARKHYAERHHALQHWWADRLFAGLRYLFALQVEVQTHGELSEGPMVLVSRHVSTADTLLPMVIAAIPHGLHVRYVLKRALLWDPCLDIVGQRVPNAFVQRGGLDAAGDLEQVRSLADDLGPRDCVVIFPEGTRFTAARRERILGQLAAGADTARLERARALRHVLPVRTGGLFALLDAAPQADLVVLAHTGLEGITRMSSLVDGTLIGRRLQVQLRRVPRAEVPTDPQRRMAWMHAQWVAVDTWVGDRLA